MLCCITDHEKDHNDNGFKNWEGSIQVYCPSLIDKEKSIETLKELAKTLTQPIEKLEQRAAVGLGDRAEQLAALHKRHAECILDLETMAQFDCSFGIVEIGSGLRHGPDGFSLDWALVDPQPERVPRIPNIVSEMLFPY